METTPTPKSTPLTPEKVEQNEEHASVTRFFNIFKKLHINIPFDTLRDMPKYSRYLQEIVACKRDIRKCETITLTYKCSSRVMTRLPKKLDDSGSLTPHIQISERGVGHALYDLRERINLMPLSMFKELGVGNHVQPTSPYY